MREKKKYSVSVIMDTSSHLSTDKNQSPLKILISIGGKRFKVGTNLFSSRKDFESVMQPKGGSDRHKEVRKKLTDLTTKAEEILTNMPKPEKDSFLRLFKSEMGIGSLKSNLAPLFKAYEAYLIERGSINYAVSIRTSLSSFVKYEPNLNLEDINPDWLKAYERHMTQSGSSTTTVQIYLRNLRTIYSRAIKDGVVSSVNYPFGKDYSIGTSVKSKAVLFEDDIKKLVNYKGKTLRQRRSVAYWMFCYFGGMNYKDVCYLKKSNVDGEFLTFLREKTKHTNRVSGRDIRLHMHPIMRKVIDDYGDKTDSPYLFPILKKGVTDPMRCEKTRNNFQRRTNDHLKEIGEELGFKVPLLLSLARHSMATALMNAEVNISMISNLLGHQSLKTTSHYLHGMPNDKLKDISDKLFKIA